MKELLSLIGIWCTPDTDPLRCKSEMLICVEKRIQEWSEEKAFIECWKAFNKIK